MNTHNTPFLTVLLSPVLWTKFLAWYFGKKPYELLKSYVAYADVITEVFSFRFLLRTLISPWKGILDSPPERGFDLTAMLEAIAFNLVSRLIGLVIRGTTLLVGLVLELLLLIASIAFIIMWIVFPIVFLAALLFLAGIF